MQHITAPELAALLADGSGKARILLDVREPWEYQTCRIEGAISIPMNTIPDQLAQLDKDAAIVCICHHGARSMRVAHFLESQGYTHVTNLTGGIHAWAQQVDPAMPTY
ncbi:Putative rhodanese-related sulfurtransferase [Herminiimonas arsenicoxydans]|uniref:Rhodanese-related sulfurtransferase n=1 Tax=Herminiimonas arsenicoxydans TaxID=204773 RepID=A4G8J3_HERAR|nr:Putative rhodanese-related sulfurtransferase [Herminiimonas arsenicoxydans]